MCGIIGLMNATTELERSSEWSAGLEREVSMLQAEAAATDVEGLEKQLSALSERLMSLPGFAASWALGTRGPLRAALERALEALRAAHQAVERGQEEAQEFAALERWNQLGIVCQDLQWRLEADLFATQAQLERWQAAPWPPSARAQLRAYWGIEFVLRSLQRLEIRGRDSSGISILVHFATDADVTAFLEQLEASGLSQQWTQRCSQKGLSTGAICGSASLHKARTLSFLYKVASEVGRIGQNIQELRSQIQADPLLRLALQRDGVTTNPLAHTRWASNGIINLFNAHPQGDDTHQMSAADTRLFAALNGDIDNFGELLDAYQRRTGRKLPPGVTTDAKIIPLLVAERFANCGDLREAFRLVLQEFRGSFAIALHHLDRPDQVWLGIGGSGQSLYVGLHDEAIFYASELYGIVEGTPRFVKLDGEREREPGDPSTRGQLLELDRTRIGTARPFEAWSFDGVPLTEAHLPIQTAQITTRDINIAGYPHFFLKEISESVDSVRKTLHGRFFLEESSHGERFRFHLDESSVPKSLTQQLGEGRIKRIYCIGQGTAAVAAMGVAACLQHDLPAQIDVLATKASELSGHMLAESMEDTLVIAVSQSGTTTDTNRTVDLVRQRGARVLAILNRRNSDLAFKADGVIFTSDGRDVEMSVASTKAFYSQVTAGALLSLYLGYHSQHLSSHEVHDALRELTTLPQKMARVLALSERVKEIAQTHALTRRYWAVVGSGSNQIAAQEIRIKLSELCYKSISCDTIEDKKHIDLSAEPLMLVCAAGLDEANLNDTVKEVAIFKAHHSIPIVLASRGADRFEPYATAVLELPEISPHLSPILTTVVGHLFGYHAACAIDEQAVSLRRLRGILLERLSQTTAQDDLETASSDGLLQADDTTLIDALHEMLQTLQSPQFNSTLEVQTAIQLALTGQRLLIRLLNQSGILPDSDRGDAPDELGQQFLTQLTEAIQELSRPIDAIKHQAKTVTVGISRPTPTLRGVIGRVFQELQLRPTAVLWRNLAYLIAAEPLLAEIPGATLYHVTALDKEGLPTPDSKIFKETAIGIAATIPSRTATDSQLQGSKWLALKKNCVSIGVGRRDNRHIAIIPLRAASPQEARILLLHLTYNENAPLKDRLHLLRTRGSIYDQLRASCAEIGIPWDDNLVMKAPVETLFDESPDRFLASISDWRPSTTSLPALPPNNS